MQRTVLALSVSFAIGCSSEADVVLRSEHIEVATTSNEICAGSARHLERQLVATFEAVGEPIPPGRFLRYDWLSSEEVGERCRELSSVGCAYPEDDRVRVFSWAIPHPHEVAHAVHLAAAPEMSDVVLAEGFAVAFGDSSLEGLEGSRAQLGRDRLPSDQHGSAARVVQSIFVERGAPTLMRLMREIRRGLTREEAEARFERVMGESWDRVVERAEAWSFCPSQLGRCSAPSLDWEDAAALTARVDLRCTDPETMGPAGAPVDDPLVGRLYQVYTVTIPEDGSYLLSAGTDAGIEERAWFWTEMTACGPCDDEQGTRASHVFSLAPFESPIAQEIRAGVYTLSVATTASDPARPITVSIRRS